ncbi:MAG: hypothetical protein IPI67_30400 [Myxococcales bacterium]|nr:hypothetical protein [Myxococcales bacterium]
METEEEVDREVRESIRVISQQRATKKWTVLIGMVVALVALCAAVLLAYRDTGSEKGTGQSAPAVTR